MVNITKSEIVKLYNLELAIKIVNDKDIQLSEVDISPNGEILYNSDLVKQTYEKIIGGNDEKKRSQ